MDLNSIPLEELIKVLRKKKGVSIYMIDDTYIIEIKKNERKDK